MAQEGYNMKTSMKAALAAAIGMSALGLGGHAASALPMSGLAAALAEPAEAPKLTEEARWVCGPYGNCAFAPGYRRWGPPRYWGPARPWAPYGYGRPWPRYYGGGYYRHYW